MYNIVIPSYNRLEQIQKYALNFIQTNGLYLESSVYIFVDPRCWDKYQVLDNKYSWLKLVKGKEMLTNQRNVIRDYFDEGQCLLIMDDDFRGLKLCKELLDIKINKNKASYEIIKDQIHNTFGYMKNNHLTLCGVHPTNNAYFASGKLSKGLKFAVGCFYFEINSKNPLLYHGRYCQKYNDEMEDYMRTFYHYRLCMNVGRNDMLAVNHRYNSAKGGMNENSIAARLMNRDRISVAMKNDYPTYFKTKPKAHGKCKIQEARFHHGQYLHKKIMVSRTETGIEPGMYYQPTDNWTTLDEKYNYSIYDDNGLLLAEIRRDIIDPTKWSPYLLRAISSWTKYCNSNRSDIAGKLDINKLPKFAVKNLKDKSLTLDTCKQNSAGTRICEPGFQNSNITHCITIGEYSKGKISQYDNKISSNNELAEAMKNILFQIQNCYEVFMGNNVSRDTSGLLGSRFKSVTINKSLRSANHKDGRNSSDYAMCFSMDDPFESNRSFGGDLLLPEYRLACNLRRNRDIIMFRSKDTWHCNSSIVAEDPNAKYHNRMSWVFFSK